MRLAVTVLKNIGEGKKSRTAHLQHAIKYILNPKKTEDGMWVGGNCGMTADEIFHAMMGTKEEYGKLTGRQGYHYVISFKPDEASPEQAYQIGKEFCETYLGEAFDYAFAVHNDQRHRHVHIIFNSVNRDDGYKYRYENGDWLKDIQPITDALCRKYGLSVLEYDPDNKVGKSYAERRAEKDGRMSWSDIIRADILEAASRSRTMDEYFENMRAKGYSIRIGHSEKHGIYAAYHAPGADKARRDYRLGPGFRMDDIELLLGKERTDQIEKYLPRRVMKVPWTKWDRTDIQLCMVARIQRSRFCIYMYLGHEEAAQSRKDLLRIDLLQEDCRYLIRNHVKSRGDLELIMSALRKKENQIRADPDYQSDTGKRESLGAVREEKRIVRRLLKEWEETMRLKPEAQEILNRTEVKKNLSEKKMDGEQKEMTVIERRNGKTE